MPKLCSFGCAPSGVHMHRFPNLKRFPKRFMAWVKLVGGKLERTSDYEHYQKKLVCDIHFKDEDRTRNNRLSALAVPSLNLPRQPAAEQDANPTPSPDIIPPPSNVCATNTEQLPSYISEQVPILSGSSRHSFSNPKNSDYTVNAINDHNYCIASRPISYFLKTVMNPVFFIGVDVGSGSVRAALVDGKGHVIKTSTKDLKTWKPKADFYEQSSNDVWECCEHVIKVVIENINTDSIKGIGFDATCSLVALDTNGNPKAVSDSGNNDQNIIMWMDHRAQAEADMINKTGHDILNYVGGQVSLEMQMPKLLWLKKHMSSHWSDYGYFLDLPDFLTWKATGVMTRSLCSLVCKWNYEYSSNGYQGWNIDFLKTIGLADLSKADFKKIGDKVLMPGELCGGLVEDVAQKLGLIFGTPVATSIIDAHAGGLGMIGARGENIDQDMSTRLGLICGTSTCHMAVNINPIIVKGVWGPYYSAMVPGMWLNEAGQSASGMLLDYVIHSHPARKNLLKDLDTGELRNYLRGLLQNMANAQGLEDVSLLTKDLHIWPDFHGNRSPLADPTMKGMVIGLTMNNSDENLALVYLATLQALSYGTRHIIEALLLAGYKPFKSLPMCGGITKDPLFVQIQADSVGLPVLLPHEKESVLVGSAILGACASQHFKNVPAAIKSMGGKADVIIPNHNVKLFHDKKYKVFLRMFKDQLEYRNIMSN